MAVEEQLNQVEALYEDLLNSAALRSRKSTEDCSPQKSPARSADLFSDSKSEASSTASQPMNPITERCEEEEEDPKASRTQTAEAQTECRLLEIHFKETLHSRNLTIKDITFKAFLYFCKYQSLKKIHSQIDQELKNTKEQLERTQSELNQTHQYWKDSLILQDLKVENSSPFNTDLSKSLEEELSLTQNHNMTKHTMLSVNYADKLDSIHKNIINQLVSHIYTVFVQAIEDGGEQTKAVNLFKRRLIEKIGDRNTALALNLENYDQ